MVVAHFSNLVQNFHNKMTLIYIANARIPTEKAHGIQIMQMCRTFANSKFDVELVIPKRFNYIKTDPFQYYGIKRSFEIKKLPCLDLIVLDKYIGHLGLWVESFTYFISLFFYLLFKNPSLIYTRNVLLLPLTFLKKNVFFEAHTFPRNYSLYSPFFKRLKGIVVITQKLKDLFVQKGISPDKILVASDGVDLEKFNIKETKEECRKKLNLPLDKKIVLYTGHLYQWKGVQTLVAASEYLPANVEVYFVGGTTKDIRDFRLQTLNLKLKIVGHKPYSEIPCWLRASDVLVLPNSAKEEISKSWTSPLKLFEYMAAKKPIISSDLPSLREVLNEGNAILVKPDSPEELAEGIKKALENPGLANKISEQAFLDVKQYTWDNRVKKISMLF